jgi:hypothetical protein
VLCELETANLPTSRACPFPLLFFFCLFSLLIFLFIFLYFFLLIFLYLFFYRVIEPCVFQWRGCICLFCLC